MSAMLPALTVPAKARAARDDLVSGHMVRIIQYVAKKAIAATSITLSEVPSISLCKTGFGRSIRRRAPPLECLPIAMLAMSLKVFILIPSLSVGHSYSAAFLPEHVHARNGSLRQRRCQVAHAVRLHVPNHVEEIVRSPLATARNVPIMRAGCGLQKLPVLERCDVRRKAWVAVL